ncbi:UDP-N-acetylglucosamine transferase subunit [Globodera pallida]|nr:UDP-N-acetylglucosamine transferase subunit [Globodera pallida]
MIRQKRQHLTSIFKKNGVDLDLLPLSVKLPMSCFQLILTAEKIEDKHKAKISLFVKPQADAGGYELIVDYKLVVGTWSKLVQKDKWNVEETLLSMEHDSCYIDTLELCANIRETLASQDIKTANSFRSFNVLCSGRSFYLNTAHLNSLGGRMFKEWYERECQGEQNAVIQSIDADELEELLRTCCAYGPTPAIHRKNFRKVLEIADKEKITGLLRMVESFIIDFECIHPIQKLEYAAEYRMSRLADTVLRSFPVQLDRLDLLFAYLAQNGETLADVHLDVLKMLQIYDSHIIILRMYAEYFLEQFFSWAVIALAIFNGCLLVVNLAIWWRGDAARQSRPGRVGGGRKLMAVLGSGGHTTEMFKMLAVQDDLFPERTYVIAQSDKLSGLKVEEFEREHGNRFSVKTIPRAREVDQSYLSAVGSTLTAFFHSFLLVNKERADVVISNGPAIGLGICFFARFFDLTRIHRCRVVFIESICRVQKLSLTGWIVYHFRIAHAFLVQWKDLQKKYPKTEYVGRLV